MSKHPLEQVAEDAARSSPADRAIDAGREANRADREGLRNELEHTVGPMHADDELDGLVADVTELADNPASVRSDLLRQLPADMREDERSDREILNDYALSHRIDAATRTKMRSLVNSAAFKPTGAIEADVRQLHRLARRK